MVGTPVDWAVGAIARGPGQLWTNLSVPAAGGKLKLATDGTPDATDNPNATHVGMTEAGSSILLKQTFTDFFSDEFVNPIIKSLASEEAAITGSWLQVTDLDIVKLLTPGLTQADGAGFNRLTFGGSGQITYYSTALIFPLESNPALFGVFHLYKAVNDPGLAFEVSRKKLGSSPFAFRGVSITTRTSGDQVGAYWKQTSIGS
jgi:hypothetical protein